MIDEKIKNFIKGALQEINVESSSISLEHPEDFKNGDYSTNVALALAKKSGKNPRELAEKIVSVLRQRLRLSSAERPQNEYPEVREIQVAGAGFINFYLSEEFFEKSVLEIIGQGDKFGQNNIFSGKKILVEHTDPNPFKEFHIGHLMPNVIGSSIARILAANGGEVREACYQGDVGMHVAKAVWGMLNGFSIKEAYAKGNRAFEEHEETKKEIAEINKKIYARSDTKINEAYDLGRRESLEYFDSVYKRLGTHFDYFFFESEAAGFGREIVEKNVGKVFQKGEGGAVIFEAQNFDKSLHTRVFINSEGLPTYEAKELGLAKLKYEKYKYDKSVIITGNEINEYFKVLISAMTQIFPELAEKTTHLSHGMLRLPTGKMSSRTGDVITAESLIEMVKEKVKGDEDIAIGAIKYMILRQSMGGNIIFDIDKSVSIEGNSGVYLQYAYVRSKSVVEKGKEMLKDNPSTSSGQEIENKDEALLKILYRFPEVVRRSGEELAPHHIATYLTELASTFNSFYANNQIIDPENIELSHYRISLSKATNIVLKNGLNILGIPTPEKM